MNINLCGACGWLGSDVELVAYNGNVEINPELKTIIKTNGLTSKCCPLCKSPFIFSKMVTNFNIPFAQQPIPWVPNMQSRMPLDQSSSIVGMPSDAVEKDAQIGKEEAPGEIISIDDTEIDSDIVTDILARASEPEEKLLAAQDLADGLNDVSKEVIAQIADVPKEKLKDRPKKKKIKKKEINRSKALGKFKCDDCGKKFESRIKEGKCPKCSQEFMRKFVG